MASTFSDARVLLHSLKSAYSATPVKLKVGSSLPDLEPGAVSGFSFDFSVCYCLMLKCLILKCFLFSGD